MIGKTLIEIFREEAMKTISGKGKRVTLLRDGVVVKEFIPPSEVILISGHVYRGKKVRVTGFINPVYDDRSIMYLDQDVVQFDHPSLRNGKHYSKTTRERFIAWAARDATDQCPPGEWISVRAVTCTNHGKA